MHEPVATRADVIVVDAVAASVVSALWVSQGVTDRVRGHRWCRSLFDCAGQMLEVQLCFQHLQEVLLSD